MPRPFAISFAVLFVAWLAAPAALAQDADVAAELRRDPVYVAAGAEQVDRAEIAEAIAAAADLDLDVRVAVLASGDGEAQAVALLGDLPETTVVVFTPTSYGVASDEISPDRLADALAAARDELAGSEAATGLAAFVDALDDGGGPSLPLIALAVVAILLVVGVAGRVWDTRTRARRQARRRERRRAELAERLTALGGRVVDLSDRVELSDSAEASRAYAEAADVFGEAERRLAEAGTMKDLDAIEADLARADGLLDTAAAAT